VLIEWTKTDSELEAAEAIADVSVFTDGRVRLGPRFGDGDSLWGQLSDDELEALRRWVFDELRVLDIDDEALSREVKAAAAQRKASTDNVAFEMVTGPQMDANSTLLRAADEGRANEIRFYDLFGNAETYPEVETLQRLRRIELRLLEIADELAHRKP
jgi:hypothetical protein